MKTAKKSDGAPRTKRVLKKAVPKKRGAFEKLFSLRWFKKAGSPKDQMESLDLLDQWILKKRALSLFL